MIHGYLSRSYWAADRPKEVIAASLENSLCFGMFAPDGAQVGFARAVTDFATMYWLADVFILEEHRGKALGKWLVECIVHAPQLEKLSGILATRDAHGLYARHGFAAPENPKSMMRKKGA
ncbi:MAG: GNAT family N-acetyltransferase [Anaerolineaceae bacterium]|nr:GNAT family N-acetyltransferase [Anaerolineaceae bacterium]